MRITDILLAAMIVVRLVSGAVVQQKVLEEKVKLAAGIYRNKTARSHKKTVIMTAT